jgi:hypothetical protein
VAKVARPPQHTPDFKPIPTVKFARTQTMMVFRVPLAEGQIVMTVLQVSTQMLRRTVKTDSTIIATDVRVTCGLKVPFGKEAVG